MVPENINNIIDNYKGAHKSLDELIQKLENIIGILANKKDKVENYKLDKVILDNLKEKIKKAFDEHLNELTTLNIDEFNNNTNKVPSNNSTLLNKNSLESDNNNLLESTSKMKKRSLSLISLYLYYDSYNSEINSPISTKSNDEMSSTLDNLSELILLLYSNNKDKNLRKIYETKKVDLKETFDDIKKNRWKIKYYFLTDLLENISLLNANIFVKINASKGNVEELVEKTKSLYEDNKNSTLNEKIEKLIRKIQTNILDNIVVNLDKSMIDFNNKLIDNLTENSR